MKKSILFFIVLFLVYNPAFSQNGQWLTFAPMLTPRQEMPIVKVNDKIYVLGGLLQNGNATPINEIYSPHTNSWTTGAAIPLLRHHHMVSVAHGKIYLMGGFESSFLGQDNNSEYDPVLNVWTPKAPLPTPRGAGISVEFSGKIYVFGGLDEFGNLISITEEYDPINNTWQTKAPLPTVREHLAAAVFDSLIYIIGGRDFTTGGPGNYRIVEAYSPATNTWHYVNDMSVASGGLAASSSLGNIYKFGGEIPAVFEEVERYDPLTGIWDFDTPMKTPRHGMGAVNFNDTIYVIGGGTIAGLQTTSVNEAFIPGNSVSIQQIGSNVNSYKLHQNYPNPFNPVTSIKFDINLRSFVKLTIYDMRGSEIETLIEQDLNTGSYKIEWNAIRHSSGVYYYRLVTGDYVETLKMILVK
jgi:N-acetylneuraminic acid mutarotase